MKRFTLMFNVPRLPVVPSPAVLPGFVFLCVILTTISGAARVESAELTADDVRQRLKRGVRFLKEQQEANGSWSVGGELSNYGRGKTALCTLALLHAGVDPADETIVKALRDLATVERESQYTYSVSLQIMVFCMVDPGKYGPQLLDLVGWLQKAQIKDGDRVGGWPYTLDPSRRQVDNSNSQFALLALHEAARVGIPIDDQVWGRALEYWKDAQNERTGAFGYIGEDNVSGTMVCAGISSLIIAHEHFQATLVRRDGDSINCCGREGKNEAIDERVARAVKWLSNSFSVRKVPGSQNVLGANFQFYYLYGLERAGRLAGVRFIGDHDWYREGAEYLVSSQSLTGAWRGSRSSVESDESVATAFALLFLAKGRRPIVVAKYKYGDDDEWNRHRKGVHFLTNAVERSWKRDLNWQTVDGNRADVNDLLESPVLFISGRKQLELAASQKKALREYVNQGGFIFAEARDGDGCDGSRFDRSFRELMGELFPGSALQAVSPDHPLWFADQPIEPSAARPLLGLQACCRTSVVYCPKNLSCYWSLDRGHPIPGVTKPVQMQIDYCVQLGVNVLAYATNQNLRDKLDRRKVSTTDDSNLNRREEITIAKVRHDGGADDAPVALSNLLQSARTETGQAFVQRKELLSIDSRQLPANPFLFQHGRKKFSFNKEQRAELRKSLIQRRFFLFGDAICGSEAFAESFRNELKEILPDYPLVPLPADHPLLTDAFGGFQIDALTLREPFRNEETGRQEVRRNRITPALEAIEIDGRIAVIFSRYDISCALENSGSVECPGYSTEDATRLGINILLYALQN